MAISRTDTLQSWEAIIAWMQANLVPNFLQSVAVDQTDNTMLICTGVGGQKLFGMKMGTSTHLPKCYLYYSDETEYEISASQTLSFSFAAVCKNGAMLRFSKTNVDNVTTSNMTFALLFTKDNNGKSVAVCTTPSTTSNAKDQMCNSVRIVAEGDVSSIQPLTFTRRSMEQTQLVPFASNPVSNVASYTPNAYYVQCGNFYDIAYTTFVDAGNVAYITNGCWAVKDE